MRKWTLIIILLLLTAWGASAQAGLDACPAFIDQALLQLGSNCADMARNSVCYGYNRVDASFARAVADTFFSVPSDRADLIDLSTIQTTPLAIEANRWGIAVMNVQANVPNTLPGTAVTFLLMGDVSVTNGVTPEDAVIPIDPVPVRVLSSQRVNLRSGPDTTFNVVGMVAPNSILQADGVSPDGGWLRVVIETGYGWIARQLVGGETAALATLPVVTEESLAPMQAFYFSTGVGTSQCVEAPEMLVIQGPQEVRVDLTINGTKVNLGSTLVFTGQRTDLGTLRAFDIQPEQLPSVTLPDETECILMRLFVLDGDAQLEGLVGTVPLGHFSQTISCMGEDRAFEPVTRWDTPVRLTQSQLQTFAILQRVPPNLLRYPIVLPTDEDIDDALRQSAPTPQRPPTNNTGGNTDDDDDDNDDDDQDDDSSSQTDPNAVNCALWYATSPPDGGPVSPYITFYWNPVTFASAYQIEVNGFYNDGTGAGTQLLRVGASETSVALNIFNGAMDDPDYIRWKAQVLQGVEPNLVAVCETPYYQNPIDYNKK